MTEDNPTAEVLKSEVKETQENEFYADIRVRIHNPDGMDVVKISSYKARPKDSRPPEESNKVHEYWQYWWPNSYPANGDSFFAEQRHRWTPSADIEDDDALIEECLNSATYDPVAELDAIKHNHEWTKEKLENNDD